MSTDRQTQTDRHTDDMPKLTFLDSADLKTWRSIKISKTVFWTNAILYTSYSRESKNLVRKTAQYFLDTTYQRSRYNSIMVRDIEKCYITQKLQILICNNFCLVKTFAQHIFKALFTKKPNYAIRTEATPVGRSKTSLHQKLHIVICNNFCRKKIFVQCIFKARFAQKPNCALRAEATPVGRFCSYAIPTESFII